MCPDFTSPSITNSPVHSSKLMTCYVPEEASNPAPVAPAACHDEAGWNRGVFRRKVGNTWVGPRLGQVGHRLPFPVVANFGRCVTTYRKLKMSLQYQFSWDNASVLPCFYFPSQALKYLLENDSYWLKFIYNNKTFLWFNLMKKSLLWIIIGARIGKITL